MGKEIRITIPPTVWEADHFGANIQASRTGPSRTVLKGTHSGFQTTKTSSSPDSDDRSARISVTTQPAEELDSKETEDAGELDSDIQHDFQELLQLKLEVITFNNEEHIMINSQNWRANDEHAATVISPLIGDVEPWWILPLDSEKWVRKKSS